MKISNVTHLINKTEKDTLIKGFSHPYIDKIYAEDIKKHEHEIGYLSLKDRCPNCGIRLWQNREDDEWCTCGWHNKIIWKPLRSILHITVGNKNWKASIEEIKEVSKLFQAATQDPKGATIITRDGVKAEYITMEGNVKVNIKKFEDRSF